MNKFTKWLKNNKKKVITIGVVLLVIIVFVVFLWSIIAYLVPNTKESVYGDRCEVTEKNPIASDREEKIKEFLEKDYKKMKLISYDIKCNLVDIIIEVDDKTSFSDVKKMSNKLIEVFEENELKYYDIELMIKSNNEKSEDYPRIGTHHKEINGTINKKFVW